MNGRSPQDLVFTLFGDFLLHREGPVWVGSLIALLEPLGLSETNVRTVLSRMAAKGWLTSEREGRRSYYELTGKGRRLLEEGEVRIHHPPLGEEWDGEWTLLAYSIPEEQRALRDRLRVRLSWLGFGSFGNGLWLSPRDLRTEVEELSEEMGVEEHLEVFRGNPVGTSDPERLIARCWDLSELNDRYDAFVGRHLAGCVALRDEGPDAVEPREAFERRFRLVHEYREFPLLDPFLPRPLQPADWAGECALSLFQYYHDLLEEPADRFVESLVEHPSREAAAAASTTSGAGPAGG